MLSRNGRLESSFEGKVKEGRGSSSLDLVELMPVAALDKLV